MAASIIATLFLASSAAATFSTNLNYASPSRRHAALGIDLPKLVKRNVAPRSWSAAELNFTHGVASGDPYPTTVILWTRISPTLKNDVSNVTVKGNVPLYNHDTETYIKASPNPICVEYHVGSDREFTEVVDHGVAYTTSDIDYTVKVCCCVSCILWMS
jgi:alkaline phosphatase D